MCAPSRGEPGDLSVGGNKPTKETDMTRIKSFLATVLMVPDGHRRRGAVSVAVRPAPRRADAGHAAPLAGAARGPVSRLCRGRAAGLGGAWAGFASGDSDGGQRLYLVAGRDRRGGSAQAVCEPRLGLPDRPYRACRGASPAPRCLAGRDVVAAPLRLRLNQVHH